MRKVILAQLEAIARRGPGWGTRIKSQTADGKPSTVIVSKSWFMRQMLGADIPAQPRADKGVAYTYDAPKVRTRDEDGKPLTFSGQTRRLVRA